MGKKARKSYVSGNIDQLGVDILLNILARLHVKSFKKIRCVCKLWLKIIDDHLLHNMRVVEQTKINLVIAKKGELVRLHKAYDQEGIKKIYAGQSPSEFRGNGYYPYGSCNGLFYFVDHKQKVDQIMVSNPVSNEFKVLPPMNIESYRPPVLHPKYLCAPINAYGLGFDSPTNTFKAICVFHLVNLSLATAVHNLGTNSWRKISSVPRYPIFGKPVFVNGFLYWEWTYSLDDVPITVSKAIVSFDVRNEIFKLVPHPPLIKRYRLLEFDGKLAAASVCLCDQRTSIWILDDKRKKWRIVYSIDTTSPYNYLDKRWTQVAGNWKQDEIYLKSDDKGGYWIYNTKTGHKKHKRISGIDCCCADVTESVDVYSHTWSLTSIP